MLGLGLVSLYAVHGSGGSDQLFSFGDATLQGADEVSDGHFGADGDLGVLQLLVGQTVQNGLVAVQPLFALDEGILQAGDQGAQPGDEFLPPGLDVLGLTLEELADRAFVEGLALVGAFDQALVLDASQGDGQVVHFGHGVQLDVGQLEAFPEVIGGSRKVMLVVYVFQNHGMELLVRTGGD